MFRQDSVECGEGNKADKRKTLKKGRKFGTKIHLNHQIKTNRQQRRLL
ncbi:unnamed protein product [Acanthoscelides obtectus]|uniref:Uncharacterized protein n=1 Tax=Acanthoscelides obtectus TaxID=200917 RepID=A0A9P0P666_ACAOB|nr:unnamed protein product [Acanthoscelides obtectus]CAK1667419.1 hypothetical protein AOBTE_LOCUS25825 [Acanthoscelides obtectus]